MFLGGKVVCEGARRGVNDLFHSSFLCLPHASLFLWPETKKKMSEQELFEAAKSGDLGLVQVLVGAHPDWVNAGDSIWSVREKCTVAVG